MTTALTQCLELLAGGSHGVHLLRVEGRTPELPLFFVELKNHASKLTAVGTGPSLETACDVALAGAIAQGMLPRRVA